MRERAHGGCRKLSIFDPLAPADKPGRIGPLEVSVVILRVCSPLPIATLEEPLRRRRHRSLDGKPEGSKGTPGKPAKLLGFLQSLQVCMTGS